MAEDFKSVETEMLLEMLAQHTMLYTSLFRADFRGDNFNNMSSIIKEMIEELNSRKCIVSTVSVSEKEVTFTEPQ